MKNIFCFIFCIFYLFSNGQELKVNVSVKAPSLNFADPSSLKNLENSASEFLNSKVWTNDDFETHERIEVEMTIFIREDISPTQFTADISFQALRPVFNSNYKTPVINFVDKDINFTYQDLQPIQDNSNVYTDELSAVMTFYAYAILGFDYDTFATNGGDEYFRIAQDIIGNAPKSGGWSKDGTDFEYSRFWLIENMFNPKIRNLRQAIYDYHRQGLDLMHEDQDKALAIMTSAVTAFETVWKTYPNGMVIQVFTDTKKDEVVEVFKGGTKGQKEKVHRILTAIDPARADQYDPIIKL